MKNIALLLSSIRHLHITSVLLSSVLQELSVQKGDICPACWSLYERRHPINPKKSVCLLPVCLDSQQQ